MNTKLIPIARHMIQANEGYRAEKYRDTKGFWTIGFGHNLDASGKKLETLVVPQAERLFTEDFETHRHAAQSIEAYHRLDDIRKLVLIDMVFQMGKSGVLKFQKTLRWIALQDYEKASLELMDSKYARIDSPTRARHNAVLLKNGFLFDIPVRDIAGLTPEQNRRKKENLNRLLIG